MVPGPYTAPMTVLLIGDSLTAGNLGIPYARHIDLPPDTRIRNFGRDGDTVRGVRSRLAETLAAESPDIVVLQVGANDVLIPAMVRLGGPWPDFADRMRAVGAIPTPDPKAFEQEYRALVAAAGDWGVDGLVCVTAPPVGEDLNSTVNRERIEINRIIRTVAEDGAAVLADAAEVLESELRALPLISDWFFDSPERFAADVRRIRREKGASGLSEERGLYLTMDGAHLNERGAALMGRVVGQAVAAI